MEVYWPHFSVVVRQVISGKIISQVCRTLIPEDMEIILFDLILDPIKAHIHVFL